MTNKVLFNLDSKVKDKAMKRAERDGIAFATVLKLAAKAYADGNFNITITERPLMPNAKTRSMLKNMEKDFRSGKNISPSFANAEDAISWLKR